MMNQYQDHTRCLQPACTLLLYRTNQGCYAEVPALALDQQSRLVDRLIGFAFETLGARHLEVRVSETRTAQAR
jgi:hypothetical protein